MKIKRPSGVTVHLEDYEADKLVRVIDEILGRYDRNAGYVFPLALADFAQALKESKR